MFMLIFIGTFIGTYIYSFNNEFSEENLSKITPVLGLIAALLVVGILLGIGGLGS